LTFQDYFDNQHANLEQLRRLPQYIRLLLPLEALYRRATDLVPPDTPPIFGRLLLLSHRSFLSAGALALRALPDDAEAVTRRAVESARLALAFKHDPANVERWLAAEQRIKRWRRRLANEPPDRDGLRLGLKYPTDEISETLGKLLGMLSDSAVHFTPEFLDRQSWRKVDTGGETVELRLGYFAEDQLSVESGLSHLASDHFLCLKAFDVCFDRAFSRDSRWRMLLEQTRAAGSQLSARPEVPNGKTE
jgi:hypothetical protein